MFARALPDILAVSPIITDMFARALPDRCTTPRCSCAVPRQSDRACAVSAQCCTAPCQRRHGPVRESPAAAKRPSRFHWTLHRTFHRTLHRTFHRTLHETMALDGQIDVTCRMRSEREYVSSASLYAPRLKHVSPRLLTSLATSV